MTHPRRFSLLCYATAAYEPQQRAVVRSALRVGVTDCLAWTRPMLERTSFYAEHRTLLDHPRGGGYWLWKPFLIGLELARLRPGDFLVYTDCGYPWRPLVIRQSLEPVLEWCERENAGLLPGVYIPQHGPNRHWTKRECFMAMQCDSEPYWSRPQVQATFSVWQKCERAEAFVAEWLRWCLHPATLGDECVSAGVREYPEFIAHRHDQSVLTNLAIMRGVRCFGDPGEAFSETKYIDNLTDRIAGRPGRIFARNLSRRITNETRKHLRRLQN